MLISILIAWLLLLLFSNFSINFDFITLSLLLLFEQMIIIRFFQFFNSSSSSRNVVTSPPFKTRQRWNIILFLPVLSSITILAFTIFAIDPLDNVVGVDDLYPISTEGNWFENSSLPTSSSSSFDPVSRPWVAGERDFSFPKSAVFLYRHGSSFRGISKYLRLPFSFLAFGPLCSSIIAQGSLFLFLRGENDRKTCECFLSFSIISAIKRIIFIYFSLRFWIYKEIQFFR